MSFDSEEGKVDDDMEGGIDAQMGVICRGCGYVCDEDSVIWNAMQEALTAFHEGGD